MPKLKYSTPDIEDLTFLSWQDIRRMGGPSMWTLKRAERRGEIKLITFGRGGGARASEYRRYMEKRAAGGRA